MGYSNSPQYTTYSTKRIPFTVVQQGRHGGLPGYDSHLVNMLIDKYDAMDPTNSKVYIKSRPGSTVVQTVSAGKEPRGIYYWLGTTIYVAGNTIYSENVALGTIATSTGVVGFTEFVNLVGVVTLVLVDGTDGYVFSSPTVFPTKIVSANFPTPHLPDPIFMDGYLFLAKANTQDVYNSNLNDPTLWNAGEFLSAEMYPDTIQALSKNNNYIYAVGSQSVEFFFDAANPTGTPLARNASAVLQFGTPALNTVIQTEKEVILVGQTGNGGYTIWAIDGFNPSQICTPYVRDVLRYQSTLASPTTFVAACIRLSGHKLYILTLSTTTLVYSFESKSWSTWSSGIDGSSMFISKLFADGPNSTCKGLSYAGVSVFSDQYYIDNLTPFLQEIQTVKYDFDTMDRKFMHRFALVGDVPTSSGVGNNFTLSWTDNDYLTWSTPRTLSMNNDFPMLKQLGTFRRRAFKIQYSGYYRIRIEGFEVDINKGSQ